MPAHAYVQVHDRQHRGSALVRAGFQACVCWLQAKTMGMKAIPASNLVVETLGLQGQLTPEQFLANRELILHKTFASASLLPGDLHKPSPPPSRPSFPLLPCAYDCSEHAPVSDVDINMG